MSNVTDLTDYIILLMLIIFRCSYLRIIFFFTYVKTYLFDFILLYIRYFQTNIILRFYILFSMSCYFNERRYNQLHHQHHCYHHIVTATTICITTTIDVTSTAIVTATTIMTNIDIFIVVVANITIIIIIVSPSHKNTLKLIYLLERQSPLFCRFSILPS